MIKNNIKNTFIIVLLVVTVVLAFYPAKCTCYDVYTQIEKQKQLARDNDLGSIEKLYRYYAYNQENKKNSFLVFCAMRHATYLHDMQNKQNRTYKREKLLKNCPINPIDKIKEEKPYLKFIVYIHCAYLNWFNGAYSCINNSDDNNST